MDNVVRGFMPDGEDEDAPSDAEEAEVPRHVQKYAHKLPVADEFQSRMLRRSDSVDLLLPAATAAHSQGVADNVLASLHYNTLARGSVSHIDTWPRSRWTRTKDRVRSHMRPVERPKSSSPVSETSIPWDRDTRLPTILLVCRRMYVNSVCSIQITHLGEKGLNMIISTR